MTDLISTESIVLAGEYVDVSVYGDGTISLVTSERGIEMHYTLAEKLAIRLKEICYGIEMGEQE